MAQRMPVPSRLLCRRCHRRRQQLRGFCAITASFACCWTLSMLMRALVARQPPSLRLAVLVRACSSSSAASRPPQAQIMDPVDRQAASGAQALPSGGGGGGGVPAGARVAVAQMTSGNSTDRNFETVNRLAKVRYHGQM